MMGCAGHEYGHVKLARQCGQSTDVVAMFVADENCRDAARVKPDRLHAFESLAAGDASVDQNARSGTFDHGSIASTAAGQHRHRYTHIRQNTFTDCGIGSNFSVKRRPPSRSGDEEALTVCVRARPLACRNFPQKPSVTVWLKAMPLIQTTGITRTYSPSPTFSTARNASCGISTRPM